VQRGELRPVVAPAEADRRGVRTVVLQPGDDLTALAERAVRDGSDVIGMAGGDGSQALVAAVAQRHGVRSTSR
jgi:diacylglycerol kinase family enzyme